MGSNTKFKINGLSSVEPAHPGEFVKLPAGGYVCLIRKVEMGKTKQTDKYKLMLTLDIAEGEFKGIFKESQYPPIFQQLVFDDNGVASRFFKGLLADIEASNSDFKIDSDDTLDIINLVNKKVGFLFGEKEYRKKNGEIGTFMEPRRSLTVKQVHDKDFQIPQPRLLSDEERKKENSATLNEDEDGIITDIDDNRVPF